MPGAFDTTRAPHAADETRERILRVARDLFYWHGIRATGVDRIAAEAGVGATTLYRAFGSKDELVAAYVRRESDGFRAWFGQALAEHPADPRRRLLDLFDALIVQVRPENCRGCPFLMALAEVPDPSLGAHAAAVELKAWVRAQLGALTADLAAIAHVDDSAALADHLALLMEGVYASVAALGTEGPARSARRLVEELLPR